MSRIGLDIKSTLSYRGVAKLLELHDFIIRDLRGMSIQLYVSLGVDVFFSIDLPPRKLT